MKYLADGKDGAAPAGHVRGIDGSNYLKMRGHRSRCDSRSCWVGMRMEPAREGGAP